MKFQISNKNDLLDLLNTAICEGTIKYTGSKDKVTKPFFPAFYLKAEKSELSIIAVDPYKKKTRGKFTLSNVNVLESGRIPITDYEILDKVISKRGLPKEDVIFESKNGNKIEIYSKGENHKYELRTRESNYISMYNKSEIAKQLKAWDEWHKFISNPRDLIGVLEDKNFDDLTSIEIKELAKFIPDWVNKKNQLLIMNHPKVDKPIEYTKIKIKKDDILMVVEDAEDLTYDNKTRINLEDDILMARKGKANSFVKSKHTIPFEYISDKKIDFDKEFYNIQTIMPNLFDEIVINFRKIKSNGSIYFYLESRKGDITAEIGFASIINDED